MKDGLCMSYLHNFFRTFSLLEDAKAQYFSCSDNLTIKEDLMNDLIVDCKESTEDEPIYIALLRNFTFHQCDEYGHIPCLHGHSLCFNISEICTFELTIFGLLTPCRTGSHLESCKHFECNFHFKCPESYCIAWFLVSDGKWDCPFGQDENEVLDKGTACTYLLKCHSASICIHPENICDEKPHCPFADDEQMCFSISHACPKQCHCFNLALSCIAVFLTDIHVGKFNLRSLHIVDCRNVSLGIFGPITWLANANFTQNKLTDICNSMNQFPNVVSLDFRKNFVFQIGSKCFHGLKDLKWIIACGNQIRNIKVKSFTNLQSLRYIDISHNFLWQLDSNIFHDVSHRITIKLSSNLLHDSEIAIIEKMCLNYLITDDPTFCCITPPETTCFLNLLLHQHTTSCSQLLPTICMKIVCALVLTVLVTWNFSTLLVHCETRYNQRMYNTIVGTVSIGHILSGVYLTFLFVVDRYWQKQFVLKQISWTRNTMCLLAFVFNKLFNITLPLMLGLLSFGRMMMIIFPMSSRFKNESFVKTIVRATLFAAVCLSSSFGLFATVFKFSLNKLCSHFIDTSVSCIVSNLFASIIQLMFALIVPFFDICMLRSLVKQQEPLQKVGAWQKGKKNILLKLIFSSMPNVLCWITSGSIVVFLEIGNHSDVDMLVWPTILIMPINGIVNPSIFLGMKLKRHCLCTKGSNVKTLP